MHYCTWHLIYYQDFPNNSRPSSRPSRKLLETKTKTLAFWSRDEDWDLWKMNSSALESRDLGLEITTLIKLYCLPIILYATEVMPLSASNVRVLENCITINRALYKTFGIGDASCILQMRTYLGLSSISNWIEVRRHNFMDKLIDSSNHTVVLKASCENLFYWLRLSNF